MDLPVKQGTDDNLPEWYHGVMSRRESEDLLKNKETGNFIIRLSPRTFGYILSYRGKDRCRHFIINQLQNGHLVISGESCSHNSLPALINHYQTTPIRPFGEKLALSYIKYSEINTYDNFQPPNVKQENALHQPKTEVPKNNKGGVNKQKLCVPTTQDISAPPLPERNMIEDNIDNDQINSKSKKKENEDSRSMNTDVLYSMVKETHINQKNMVENSTPDVLYSEVKCLPTVLGHLQASSQSLNQEAWKMTLDTTAPRASNSLKEHSECEVLEMRFATSIQTVNNKTLSGPFLRSRAEICGSPFLYSSVTSCSENEIYEQIPIRGVQSVTEYQSVDQVSKYSKCSSNINDFISNRKSKEVTSREINRKVTVTSAAEDNAYETIARDFSKPAGKKLNVAKLLKMTTVISTSVHNDIE